MQRINARKEAPDGRDAQNAFAVACFRAIGSADIKACRSVRDWNRAMQTLRIHGLLPILGQATDVPERVRRCVLEAKLRMATYQSNALEALSDIAREMNAAGIPFAVLKGTYLYALLYRDLFPREYGDIDLLVPADRIEDAVSALAKAGYDGDRQRAGHPSMPRWHFHAELTSSKPGGLPLELHRSMVDRANLYRVNEAELFERLKEFQTRQGGFTVLAIEDQLIYLCLHVAKHGSLNGIGRRNGFAPEWFCDPAAGNRLLWFLDIELFLRKYKDLLDWPAVAERMQRWNIADDMLNCLGVLALLRPGAEAEYAIRRLDEHLPDAAATGTRQTGQRKLSARLLRSRPVRRLLARAMQTDTATCVRPVRGILLARTMVPSPARLRQYYGKTRWLWTPGLYLWHPFHMLRKLLRP